MAVLEPIVIIQKRTDMSTEDAVFYEGMAEARIREHFQLDADYVLTPQYTFSIADIAVLLWQQDNSTKNSSASLGYSRETYDEGGVSHTVAAMTGNAIFGAYERSVLNILAALPEPGGTSAAGKVVFM